MSAADEFTAYFAARADFVRRSAYVLCGDWHRADDLAQEAFLRLSASWHDIRDKQALDAFMRTCLLRCFLRDKKRAWRRYEDSVARTPERAIAGSDADRLDQMTIQQALRRLPPRQRSVLICRYLWDMDVESTSQALKCSPGTVKSYTSRALQALRSSGLIIEEMP